MQTPAFASGVPTHDLLLAAGKLVAMFAHRARGEDPFTKMFAAQGDIEDFAASATTPLEADLAEAMRWMSAEILRRQWWNTGHPHRELAHAIIEVQGFAPYRFAKKAAAGR